jgi:hypothetical protein
MVEAQARRKWYGKDEDVAAKLMELTGAQLDDVMPRKLIGITDADKLAKAAAQRQNPELSAKQASEQATKQLANLTDKSTSGKLVLVETTDKRPAVDPVAITFNSVKTLG